MLYVFSLQQTKNKSTVNINPGRGVAAFSNSVIVQIYKYSIKHAVNNSDFLHLDRLGKGEKPILE